MTWGTRAQPAGAGSERRGAPLADLTTLRVGGPARRLLDATLEDEVIETAIAADATGEPLLVIAGGSNLVIADAGFDGTVLRAGMRGVAMRRHTDRVLLTAAAGEPWDELVARCTAGGLAGVECLSRDPGLDRRHPDPERRRLRPAGLRRDRLGARL